LTEAYFRHAVLITDRAGWHTTANLEVPDNYLSKRVYKPYSNIPARCCFAWKQLIKQLWKIMSIGMWKWAHGF